MKLLILCALGIFSLQAFADIPLPTISRWETVTADGFGNQNNTEITSVYEFKDAHFAGTYNETDGAQIFRSTRESNYQEWVRVAQLPKQNSGIWRFVAFNGRLYAGSVSYTTSPPMQYPASIMATEDGESWFPVMSNGFGDSKNARIASFGVFNNQLYVGTSHSYTGKIYRSNDGSTWEQVVGNGLGVQYLTHTWTITSYRNEIYSGHIMGVIGHSITGDKNTWKVFASNFGRPAGGKPGSADDSVAKTDDIEALAVYRDYLVAGAADRYRGAAVWAYKPEENAGAWKLASEFGIIGNNADTAAIHSFEVAPHPNDPKEQILFAGTWGKQMGASMFMTCSSKPPFVWQEVGQGGFGYYTRAPDVREVRRMGEYLYVALGGRALYGANPGKLVRIYLWSADQ